MFIDDDEFPLEDWLDPLSGVHAAQVAGVLGLAAHLRTSHRSG